MIFKRHRKERYALPLGVIEALLETRGSFGYSDLEHIFGHHNKEGIRIVARYREISPDAMRSTTNGIMIEPRYVRRVLRRTTSPQQFLQLLYTLYGVTPLEDE